ncbi:LacI family DNA-binding transcriptional regulator [Micromonospora globbae]|uniref:LacI family DNA-binding transcriptional regulator n=1 Tax=Micromonospora globbae TaxID=1894969 RepID=UPI00344993DC
MGVTLKDVARLAGVSAKTVSNVVNGCPGVSDALRRRVRDAIGQLGYHPHLAARHLRTGRTGLLALVVDTPHLDEVARAILRAAAQRGHRVVVAPRGPAPGVTAACRDVPADGILLGTDAPPRDVLDAEVTAGTPLVLLGEGRDDRCDRVGVDMVRAARDATAHLLALGRRRIAAIGADPGPSRSRTAGYRQALRRAGIDAPAAYVRATARPERTDGYHAARSLLAHDPPPDAIFCYSDPLAVGAIRAATDAGLRVPDDVAVIGFGGTEEGRYVRPSLSTVVPDAEVIARAAVTRIVARIACPDLPPAEIVAPHTVLPRESAPAPPGGSRPASPRESAPELPGGSVRACPRGSVPHRETAPHTPRAGDGGAAAGGPRVPA